MGVNMNRIGDEFNDSVRSMATHSTPDFDNAAKEYERVLDSFFLEEKPIEVIFTEVKKKLKDAESTNHYDFFMYFPVEAILERLIDGQNPKDFEKKFYSILDALKKDVTDLKQFKKIFPYSAPLSGRSDLVFYDWGDCKANKAVEDIILDESKASDPITLADELYKVVGPEERGMFPSTLSKSEFAHCIRIAKNTGKVIKDEDSQRIIIAYLLERALSFNPPKEENERGCDPVMLDAYREVIKMLGKEQAVAVAYVRKSAKLKKPDYLTL